MLVKFRPAQINWHIEMARGGIQTFAIIATRVGSFYVRGKDIVQFADGFASIGLSTHSTSRATSMDFLL
jgi:hypothetical protein